MSLKIIKIGFPSIMLDNDIQYLNYLFKVIEKIDEEADIRITKNNSDVCSISVLPSNMDYREILIKEIREAHKIIGMNIEFSKSLNISKYISWIS